MKMQKFLHSLLFFQMLLVAIPLSAYDFEVDGIFYNILDRNEKTVEVTFDEDYSPYKNYPYETMDIPSTVSVGGENYTVTEIGECAFYELGNEGDYTATIKVIKVPGTVTKINSDIFGLLSNSNFLTELWIYADQAPELDGRPFYESGSHIRKYTTLYVYEHLLPQYKSGNWANITFKAYDFIKADNLVTSVTLSDATVILTEGKTHQLSATVLPETASVKALVWSSSNSAVVPVTDDGLVLGRSPGEAIITATSTDGSEVSASCNVTVNDLLWPYEGSGTPGDPYQLKTSGDIVTLAGIINDRISFDPVGTRSYQGSGKYFKIMNDIDMSDASGFIGIGTAPYGQLSSNCFQFQGTIDGDGHTIKGMVINAAEYDESSFRPASAENMTSRNYVGFIGLLGNGGCLKNLTFAADCSVKGISQTAVAVGCLGFGGTVSNVVNYGDVVGIGDFTGGIVGRIENGENARYDPFVTDCYNAGNVTTYSRLAGGVVGGFDPYILGGKLNNLVNAGTITGTYNCGINIGYMSPLGGVIGGANFASVNDVAYLAISNLCNVGQVNELRNARGTGGVMGSGGFESSTNKTTIMTNVYNYGSVKSISAYGVGGICCIKSVISNVLNVGPVITLFERANRSGALISPEPMGFNNDGLIGDNCYYDNQIAFFKSLDGDEKSIGLPTSSLVSGASLNIPDLNYETGYYPYPTIAVNEDCQQRIREAAGMWLQLYLDNTTYDITGPVDVSESDGELTATFSGDDGFSYSDFVISIPETDERIVEEVTLTTASGYSRTYPLVLDNEPEVSFEGAGTAEDPYRLNNAEDIVRLARFCNYYRQHFNDAHFIITADIDMGAYPDFLGIGTVEFGEYDPGNYPNYFDGHIDGQGHTISNMHIDGTAKGEGYYGERNYIGFIGILGGPNSEDESLSTIENLVFDSSCSLTGNGGMAVGYGFRKYTIRNIVNHGNVVGYGGILGIGSNHYPHAVIEDCVNYGDVTRTKFCTFNSAGGIAGVFNGLYDTTYVRNCRNYGDISFKKEDDIDYFFYAGGIVGKGDSNTVFTDCANYGNVSNPSPYGSTAGIATEIGYGSSNLLNSGNVTGIEFVGGIASQIVGMDAWGIITYNDGYNLVNAGVVSGVYRVGGIVGDAAVTKLTNCANYGSVVFNEDGESRNGHDYFGGLIGINRHAANLCINCISVGSVNGGEDSEYVGAVSGNILRDRIDEQSEYNIIYDKQLANVDATVPEMGANISSLKGMTTTGLISGSDIPGLTGYTFREGYYPWPARNTMASPEDIDRITGMYLRLNDNIAATKLYSKSFELSDKVSDMEVSFENDSFAVDGGKIVLRADADEAEDVIYLTSGSVTKSYRLVYNSGNGKLDEIGNITADEDLEIVPQYYNLMGVRVHKPTKGVYIEKFGNATRKVMIP